MHLLSLRIDVARIICLVRADTDAAALERVEAATKARSLTLDKVEAYAADLGERYLGLGAERYLEVQSCTTTVMHVSDRETQADGKAAWPVHFTSSLASFESSIRGELFFPYLHLGLGVRSLNNHCMP